MSSHHFVREGQEPALLIAGPASLQQAEPLLEWVPLVIVTEEALDHVQAWGIKIDAVVCVAAHATDIELQLLEQMPFVVLPHSPADDPIARALQHLATTRHSMVNILAPPTEAIFRRAADFSTLQITLLGADVRWSLSTHFEKWLPTGSRLYLRPADSHTLTMNGLETVENGYQATHDGIVRIHGNAPFWVGEQV
ncbi:hypothetical protein KK062_28610 [Fulvivirgaceae bacterium PWU5]|uniref:Uncharacterized protein n=1 Tax=Dawidia cretensis TaxID=2782350 RepID=A0AAP2E384_9BACT|nr:hypothetical protein [Dawidia cretensis]MBT1712238.1 hypothetical protein [Dawidia cretensis]